MRKYLCMWNTWASDRTKCQDWYKHPVAGKVVKAAE